MTDVLNALSTDARIQRTARMLSMDGPLSPEDVAAVIQQYRQYTYKHNITDAQAAKQIGYSSAVVSQWTSEKYKGDIDAVTRAINEWMERDSRSRGVQLLVDYVPTRIAEEMCGFITAVLASGSMGAILAPSGVGKTMIFQLMVRKSAGFYIYCDEDLTKRAFLLKVAKTIGCMITTASSISDLKDQIIAKLMGSRRPIYLDEAHRLRQSIFSVARSIHDQSGVPIIFGGTSEMLDHLNDRASERGQMASRTLVYNAMDYAAGSSTTGGGSSMGEPLFTRDEIEALFAKSKLKIHPGAFEMLWAIACSPGSGSLRTVRKTVELLHSLKPGQAITRKDISDALTQLFGRLGQYVEQQAVQIVEDLKRTA